MTPRDAALAYARRGWHVLPCRPRGKEPLTPHGCKDATTDEQTIRSWWQRWPAANVAIATGRASGICVLDVDPRAGGDETLAALERLPPTVEALTGGGGRHLYFRHPGGHVKSAARALGPGLDVKADGGYVIAPPSVHPSGAEYAWELSSHPDDVPLAEPPGWLLALLAPPAAGGAREPPAIPERIPAGQRNATLTSLAGALRRRGAQEPAIRQALLAVNKAQCEPPLDAREVQRIAASVARYEPASVAPPLTDLANAERLVARHGHDLRFCHPMGRWIVWDGRRWAIDDIGEVRARAKEVVRSIYAEAESLSDEEQRKARARWGLASESRMRIEAMIALAQSERGIPILPAELDRDPWLLTVRNGTLDLRTGALRQHNRGDLITRLVEIDYDPRAPAPLWRDFLARIMGGNDDLIAFLQRAVGYSLTGDTSERALFFLYGSGANGKTTFLETIRAIAGGYGVRTPTETLLTRRESIPNDVARLRGARLVTAAEADEGRHLAEALVKDLTGGDMISARFLHAEWFDFKPTCKLWLAANHKPIVRGTDQAIWDRIKLIPFSVVIPEAEQDKTLVEKLRAELPGILAWAVEGCLAWRRGGLGVPREVRAATGEYREEMDVLGGFLDDCCARTGRVGAKELYQAYLSWCEANGEKPISQRQFGLKMAERGFGQFRTARGRGWMGVCLAEGIGAARPAKTVTDDG